MFQSLKKLFFVCSLILSSCVVTIYAESENPLVYDEAQGSFQEFLDQQSGDVKIVMEKSFTDKISIPDTITSLEIDLAGHSISGTMYANGIPLTISNGETGGIYVGSHNKNITANPRITLNNIRLRGDLYGGGCSDDGNSANVNGNVIVKLNSIRFTDEVENPPGMGNAHEVYGGGKAINGGQANVENTQVYVSNSYTSSIYGGGYAEGGTANVSGNSSLTVESLTSYGDMVGCGYLGGNNSTANCGSVELTVKNTYFPASWSNFQKAIQSGLIIGGSLNYYDDTNLEGNVSGNITVNVIDTDIYGRIIGGSYLDNGGDTSVGSINLLIDGVKKFYEYRLENTGINPMINNEKLYLDGANDDDLNDGRSGSFVKGNVNAVIKNSDLSSVITSGTINGDISVEFTDGGEIAGLQGINKIILGAPLLISSFVHEPTPIQIELKGDWKNGIKALTLGGKADNSLFTGKNLIYGEDEVSYWMTDGLVETPTIEPEPDHSSSHSGGSTSSTIVKGETETTVKVDNKTGSLSSSVVKKLVQENEKVPVVIENSDMKITYPKGALGDLTGALSVNVTVDGKDEITKKAAEKAGEAVMTLNFKEEKMFSAQQSVKIEIKTDTELVGKTLYYQKYDEETNQLVLVMPTVVNEEGWLEVSQLEAGCYVLSETIDPYWHKTVTDDWYYFDEQGQTVTGWLADNSDWYYLEEKGTMHKGWLSLDDTWYCMNDAGKLIKGWNPQGSIWYYHDATGSLVKNQWIWDEGSWYYIDHTGSMLRDGYTPDGFHVNQSGVYDY